MSFLNKYRWTFRSFGSMGIVLGLSMSWNWIAAFIAMIILTIVAMSESQDEFYEYKKIK